jgi:hypothetical protein
MPVLVAELAKRVCQNSHRIAILARIILARGLRPGERRGGRKKGTPNRRTSILRDLAIDGDRQLAIDHMAEVLEYYTQKVTASSRHRCQCSRCSGSSATRLAKYQSPQLQAIAVQQTPETELARKSDAELFENLQARAAALGFTIERIRPQLTLVDGSKQDERA